jgi:hypothetical protein
MHNPPPGEVENLSWYGDAVNHSIYASARAWEVVDPM